MSVIDGHPTGPLCAGIARKPPNCPAEQPKVEPVAEIIDRP